MRFSDLVFSERYRQIRLIGILLLAGAFILVLPSLLNDDVVNPVGAGSYDTPSWSPSGTYLAFQYEGRLWLYRPSTDNTSQIEMPGSVSFQTGIDWEDEQHLWLAAFSDRFYGAKSLFRVNVESGDIETIFSSTKGWTGFALDPLSDTVLVSRLIDNQQSELSLLDVENGLLNVLEVPEIPAFYPSWSPDGKYTAFVSRNGLEIQDRENNVWTVKVSAHGGVARFTWSPDSKWILYVGVEEELGLGLYIVPIHDPSVPIRQVLSAPVAYVDWSPDGKTIAYTTVRFGGQNELRIVDVAKLGLEAFIIPDEATLD